MPCQLINRPMNTIIDFDISLPFDFIEYHRQNDIKFDFLESDIAVNNEKTLRIHFEINQPKKS